MTQEKRLKRSTVFVVGTRAQFIKVAPVLVACERIGLQAHLLMTGQHKETMQDLVEEFGVRSTLIAAVVATERATIRSLLQWLPRAYAGVARELRLVRAQSSELDVVVHGDTLSTVVGAIAGRRCGARVIHMESGLTSGRLLDPFPEELSRRIVFRASDVALCPNQSAAVYMRRHHRADVVETGGNTIMDAVRLSGARPGQGAGERYVVASLHRFQNLFRPARLKYLLDLLVVVAGHCKVHFVLHPATRKKLEEQGHLERLRMVAGLQLMPRLGYREFLQLAANADCVLTDGGSNQEELAVLGVPTVVMRERTERPDGLGFNARMESQVAGGVTEYLVSGAYAELRRPPSVLDELGPSMRIARFLADS